MGQAAHIEVRGLTQVFSSDKEELVALDDVDLEVERGAFVSIVGHSGGGKNAAPRHRRPPGADLGQRYSMRRIIGGGR